VIVAVLARESRALRLSVLVTLRTRDRYDDIDCPSVETNGLSGNLQHVAGFPEVDSVTLPLLMCRVTAMARVVPTVTTKRL
jgi:hypothetical protein